MGLKFVDKIFNLFGYVSKEKYPDVPVDIKQDEAFMEIYLKCRPYTMTSAERMYALYNAIEYTIKNNIQGDLVECGVWKGGSSMLMALTLLKHNVRDRKIYLYDTFEGMSAPTAKDKSFTGDTAEDLLKSQEKLSESSIWCYSSLEEVKRNLFSTNYPDQNLIFVKGRVEDTLVSTVPSMISLLRLDTDWYESTKMELEVLYPLLERRGILIIDDFGHWDGAKQAVLEYLSKNNIPGHLHRLDYTGRLLIKI